MAGAGVQTARRFADAQISNFQQRLQALRRGDTGWSNSLSLNLGLADALSARDPRASLAQRLGQSGVPDPAGDERRALSEEIWRTREPAASTARLAAPAAPQPANGAQPASAIGLWAAGAIDWGRQDASGQRDHRFNTRGLSAGADVRITERLSLGAGVGWGSDRTRIGDNGSLSRGEAVTAALYGSWRLNDALYLDGAAGYSDLDFETRRWAEGLSGQPDDFALGDRSGDVRFASATIGHARRSLSTQADIYARVDARRISLDAFVETGAGAGDLAWDAVGQDSLSASLGALWRWTKVTRRHGVLAPEARLEWSHEFEDVGDQGVRYADWAASPTYLIDMDRWSRDSLSLSLGGEWSLSERLSLSMGYRGALGSSHSSHGGQLGVSVDW